MTTIYTSKKTGTTYTMKALENGKFQLTSTEDNTDIITTTESVLKRWYKKSIVVDFTKAEEKPKKANRKAHTNYRAAKKAEDIKIGSFLPFYPTPKAKIQVIGIESARELFPSMELDYINAFLSCESFKRPRRAYVNTKTGNVGIRFRNQLFEINGLKAYV